MRLQILMKRVLLSLNAKLDLIGSNSNSIVQTIRSIYGQAVCVSAATAPEQVTATVSNDVTLTEVFFAVHKLRLNLTVLVPS